MAERYAVIGDGVVTNVVMWDGVSFVDLAAGEELVLAPSADIGWQYRDGEFIAPAAPSVPEPSAAEILDVNTAERDRRLAAATLAIAPLQDAVDLGEATDAEPALLKKWKQYRVAVNRVDLTGSNAAWPLPPA